MHVIGLCDWSARNIPKYDNPPDDWAQAEARLLPPPGGAIDFRDGPFPERMAIAYGNRRGAAGS